MFLVKIDKRSVRRLPRFDATIPSGYKPATRFVLLQNWIAS